MQQVFNGIAHLQGIVKDAGCKRIFLVLDSSFPFINIRENINALPIGERFSDFTPNPLYEQVCKGVELFKASRCDSILAVGGGSAIDVAKCIKLYSGLQDGIPFIAIPTTAGTGSESTHNAVMYKDGVKQTVTDDSILPDFAVLEPSVLETLPLYQKKCTMMDALCQGIESWWSINSTEESKEYSRKTIELIVSNWRDYIFGNGKTAAANIMLAANYGGKAINITQTTAAHAMSYKITSLYGLPHGHAVAVCLPEVWQYMIDNPLGCIDARGSEYLGKTFLEIANALKQSTVQDAIAFTRQILKDLDLEYPVSGSKEADVAALSASVNPVRLKNNPVAMDRDAFVKTYSNIVKC